MATAALPGQLLKSYRVDTFVGGLDVKTTKLRLSRLKHGNRLTQADNMLLTTEGGVTKRFGKVAINTATLGATVKIVGGIQFRHSMARTIRSWAPMTAACCGSTRTARRSRSRRASRPMPGSATASPCYNDLLHITNGFDAPMTWDGTTFANMAGLAAGHGPGDRDARQPGVYDGHRGPLAPVLFGDQ